MSLVSCRCTENQPSSKSKPHPDLWKIDREAERQVSCVIREFQEEWFAYDELVSDWNSGSQLDRSLSAFVPFTVAWVEELTRLVPTR